MWRRCVSAAGPLLGAWAITGPRLERLGPLAVSVLFGAWFEIKTCPSRLRVRQLPPSSSIDMSSPYPAKRVTDFLAGLPKVYSRSTGQAFFRARGPCVSAGAELGRPLRCTGRFADPPCLACLGLRCVASPGRVRKGSNKRPFEPY
jgi:hypothetical protein